MPMNISSEIRRPSPLDEETPPILEEEYLLHPEEKYFVAKKKFERNCQGQQVSMTLFLMRAFAVEALGFLKKCGDENAIAALVGCLQDQQVYVVIAAMQVLISLARKCDLAIQASVISSGCLHHADWHVRRATIQTVAHLPGSGNETAIAAVSQSMKHEANSKVRGVGVRVPLMNRRPPKEH